VVAASSGPVSDSPSSDDSEVSSDSNLVDKSEDETPMLASVGEERENNKESISSSFSSTHMTAARSPHRWYGYAMRWNALMLGVGRRNDPTILNVLSCGQV
jgi:hypothetical protein